MSTQAERMKEFVWDLKSLAGGANGNMAGSSDEPARVKTAIITAADTAKRWEFKRKIGKGKVNGKDGARTGEQPLWAEQVIPLDDAEISQF